MPWLRGGTVAVTNGSATVVGTNADFAANAKNGDAFVGPDGATYEIGNVASATVISIIPAYKGVTASGAAYAIMPVQGYPKALADAFSDINRQWGAKLSALGTTGNYETLPVDKGGTGGTDQATARTGLGAAKSGVNNDITELNAVTKALTVAQGGVSKGYIEGLNFTWVSGTQISISPGAAYIPGLAKTLEVNNTLNLSITAGSLASDTFYYLYLYSNSGTPALELSTTIADAYTGGAARQKSGDPTRRFLFCIRSGSGGSFLKMVQNGDVMEYRNILNAAPYRIVAGNSSTVPYSVYLISIVPPIAKSAIVNCHNATAGTGGPTLWITDAEFQYFLIRGIDSSTRQVLRIPLVNLSFLFFFVSSGGSANFDILGYSAER
ncbi:hypothetical protein [Pseudomonas sp. GM30]|uniref:hypothetical protein n=1 Tax=Pseudomonas sp. GM30 TaxID=1144328 RepID=UPI00026FD95B|nr:hypothetical protein [Pseudomonas sp. GM30]EUB84874.1 hypothetical protein PMI25_001251 [Pseudomonas sp. GM30]